MFHRHRVAIRVVPASADQDRAEHRVGADGSDVVILADGAGGTSGGREAAERVVRWDLGAMCGPEDCVRSLRELDQDLERDAECGETTAVLVVVRNGRIFGASVGDSAAYLLTADKMVDLTRGQRRKPLLGSGAAEPVGFGLMSFDHRVLVASDGLLKYASLARIQSAAFVSDLGAATDELVAAARLPGGALQDDLAVVLMELRLP